MCMEIPAGVALQNGQSGMHVLNGHEIKSIYEEKGRVCIGLTPEQREDIDANFSGVVVEGEPEKKNKPRG